MQTKAIAALCIVLCVLTTVAVVKWPKGRSAPTAGSSHDGRLGIVVCSDGIVLRNQSQTGMEKLAVVINDFGNEAVELDRLGPGQSARVRASQSLTITQVVVTLNALDQVRWLASVNGQDPRSKLQRQKTMAEVVSGK